MIDLPAHFAMRVALFEKECDRFSRSGRGREGVVFLGDSLVERYKGPLPWVNRGICSDHLQWPEFNIFDRLGSDRLHPNPEAIVTLVGINDLNDAPHALERHAGAYRVLLGSLAQHYPHAKLAVCSLLPTSGPASHLNRRIEELNRRLFDVATLAGAVFVDLHRCFVDPATGMARDGFLVPDGVHVTRRGYAELTACVARHVPDLGITPRFGQAASRPTPLGALLSRVSRAWNAARP